MSVAHDFCRSVFLGESCIVNLNTCNRMMEVKKVSGTLLYGDIVGGEPRTFEGVFHWGKNASDH